MVGVLLCAEMVLAVSWKDIKLPVCEWVLERDGLSGDTTLAAGSF